MQSQEVIYVSPFTSEEREAIISRNRGRPGYRFAKRAIDVLASAAVIAVGFIPGAILSIAIAIDTKGSPFYKQTRVGKNGKPFQILKFRSMVADSDDIEKYLEGDQLAQWRRERKVENDPRVTKLGRWLRKYSVDELPNFLNVFAGQMSIVGPRALVEEELDSFGEDRDVVLSVPAGITGWWQVDSRNDATFESGKRQELELYYVENASLSLDVRIFGKTFVAIFSGTGV